MTLKDYSDNEAVRSRGQDLVSTSPPPLFQACEHARLVRGVPSDLSYTRQCIMVAVVT